MSGTLVTVVGNVATGVTFRESEAGGVAWFRFAVPAGRWDPVRGTWVEGPTSFYTVWARRTLGSNVMASVSIGEPLVVHGRLRVREQEWEGKPRTSADIDALAVGHDMTRGTSAFRRAPRTGPDRTARQNTGGGVPETGEPRQAHVAVVAGQQSEESPG